MGFHLLRNLIVGRFVEKEPREFCLNNKICLKLQEMLAAKTACFLTSRVIGVNEVHPAGEIRIVPFVF
jgi:hypothetical protein